MFVENFSPLKKTIEFVTFKTKAVVGNQFSYIPGVPPYNITKILSPCPEWCSRLCEILYKTRTLVM